MAAALIPKSAFLGSAGPSVAARSVASVGAPRSSYHIPIACSHSVGSMSDRNRQAISSQQRSAPHDPLPAFQSTSSQDITLLGSSSGPAYKSFWDNVLSDPDVESVGGTEQEAAKEQTCAGPSQQSSIGRDDWRAVRRVVDFDSKKAKQLRKKLRETESFHDTFYHR